MMMLMFHFFLSYLVFDSVALTKLIYLSELLFAPRNVWDTLHCYLVFLPSTVDMVSILVVWLNCLFTSMYNAGICYGFKVMRVRESPNTAFTLLLERFHTGRSLLLLMIVPLLTPRLPILTAPENIIYDNSCNLHQYALNREPDTFKLSWFLVDRFHWPNHTGETAFTHWVMLNIGYFLIVGCSIGYNLSCYPQFNSINSQMVEQANSALSRIKSSLSYMKKENFMAHCKLYLWYRNRKLREQR